jgi:hypothetical protein
MAAVTGRGCGMKPPAAAGTRATNPSSGVVGDGRRPARLEVLVTPRDSHSREGTTAGARGTLACCC